MTKRRASRQKTEDKIAYAMMTLVGIAFSTILVAWAVSMSSMM